MSINQSEQGVCYHFTAPYARICRTQRAIHSIQRLKPAIKIKTVVAPAQG